MNPTRSPATENPDTAEESATAAGTDDASGEAEKPSFTLEELASRSGVPARTIRYYQAQKLLQKPERDRKDARVARYRDEHLERLALIGELSDRGLKLPAIRTLLEEGDTTTRVADWLGLDATLRGSWGHDEPRIVSPAELGELLEGTPPGTQGILEGAGLFSRQGHSWLVPSQPLLTVATDLVRNGVDVDLVIDAVRILQQHLGKAADQLIDLFVEAIRQGFGAGIDTEVLTNALRPAAGEAARIVFAQQLERAIEELLNDTRRLGKH